MRRPLLLTLLTLATARAAAQDAARPEPTDEAPPQQSARSRFEGLGRTPEQEKQLEELSEAVQRYEEESREYKR